MYSSVLQKYKGGFVVDIVPVPVLHAVQMGRLVLIIFGGLFQSQCEVDVESELYRGCIGVVSELDMC